MTTPAAEPVLERFDHTAAELLKMPADERDRIMTRQAEDYVAQTAAARRAARRVVSRRRITTAPPSAAPRAPFNARRHLITLPGKGGKQYLEVAWRLVWFREHHPDWSILTNLLELNHERGYCIFTAQIMDSAGRVIATATKHEPRGKFEDYIEKCETGAVGRALAYCGFGTQFAPELEEGDRIADGPVSRDRAGRSVTNQPPHNAPNNRSTAPPPSSSPSRPPAAPEDPAARCCSFDGCGATLTSSQYTFSMGKFDRPLCPAHQKVIARQGPAGQTGRAQNPAPPHKEEDDRVQIGADEYIRGEQQIEDDFPEPADPMAAPAASSSHPADDLDARRAALESFANRAYDLGFDVTVQENGQEVWSSVKVGSLVCQAVRIPRPAHFNDWYPQVAAVRAAEARLPQLQSEAVRDRARTDAAHAPEREPAAASSRSARPAYDDDDSDLTDPFADD